MFDKIDATQIEKSLPLVTAYGVKILGAIVFLMFAIVVSNYLKNMTIVAMQKGRIDPTLSKFGGTTVKWTVLVVTVISILGILGVQTASFAALIAAMGLAIGLAFQGTLSNFAAGVMLLVFRPFKVGHFIKVAGESGTVDEISIFTTSLDTPDRRRIILPNSSVFGSTIENVSHHAIRRCDVTIGTGYEADLETTKAILQKVVSDNPMVLKDPEPAVVLTALGASSIDWAIRAHVKAEDYWGVYENLLWDTKNALDKNSIGIPYPQMDVHIHSNPVNGLMGSDDELRQ